MGHALGRHFLDMNGNSNRAMNSNTAKAPLFIVWGIIGVRIALGAVFVYAGWQKIVDPASFAQSIANYQLLPPLWGNLAALFLPWLELVCGLTLISGWKIRAGALLINIMLLIFMGALALSLYRGLDIHCGCFSVEGPPSNLYIDLLRDGIMLAMSVLVLFRSRLKQRFAPQSHVD